MRPYFENNINSIYVSYYKTSHSFASHFQHKIEVAHCFSGRQMIRVGNELYTLKEGDSVFIAPNVVHEYIKNEDSPEEKTETVSFMSDTDIFASLIPELITKRPVSPFVPARLTDRETLDAFRKITYTPNNNIELLGWACIALSGIIKNLEFASLKETDSMKLAPSIISYIDSNFRKNLTIKSIAGEFGYSTSYITHIFYDQLKIPFRTYLGSVRSEYAASLMQKTGKSLTEIAFECGYNSLNTFCRSFKKRFNLTPSQYKQSLKKE